MLHLTARNIINISEEAIWELNYVPIITMEFDDGSLITTGRRTILSWYYWRCLAKYPKTPILKKHHIGNKVLNKNTLRSLLNNVFDIMDIYGDDIKEHLMEETFEMVNVIYNVFTAKLSQYVRSISAFDLVDALYNPAIKAANDQALPNEGSIKETKRIIEDTLLTDPSLKNNSLAIDMRSGLTKKDQCLSLISPIGFREDINSTLFSKPVMQGYAMGIQELCDSMTESRSASKALYYSKAPLQDAEYFNRRLQFLCQIIENVISGDCGSTEYIEWHVHKKDLKLIAGQNYISDKGLKSIKDTDTHLIDKVIKMRNSLFCRHYDKHSVCSACYGTLSRSIPFNTNIGHVAATSIGEKGSQFILSVKHHDGSSEAYGIELTESDKQFIDGEANTTVLYLATKRKDRNTKLIIKRAEANNLSQVTQHPDKINTFNIFNITQLEDVVFVSEYNGIEDYNIISLSVGSRKGALSIDMLKYLSTRGWGVTPAGDFIIDFNEWDVGLPLFELPKKQMGVVEFLNTVKTQLIGGEKSNKNKKGRLSVKPLHLYTDPTQALKDVYDLINSTLDVNIAHLSIVLLAMTVNDPVNNDFDVRDPGTPIRFGLFNEIIDRRSLSVKMAYEGHINAFVDVVSYLYRDRPKHLKDEALMRQNY